MSQKPTNQFNVIIWSMNKQPFIGLDMLQENKYLMIFGGNFLIL